MADRPRRTEPLRAVRAPEAPAPQPVYLNQTYPDGPIDYALGAWVLLSTAFWWLIGILVVWGIILLPFGLQDSPLSYIGPLVTAGYFIYTRAANRR
jgi:hypothetical protein